MKNSTTSFTRLFLITITMLTASCSSNLVLYPNTEAGRVDKSPAKLKGIPINLMQPRAVVTPSVVTSTTAQGDGQKKLDFSVELIYDQPDAKHSYLINVDPSFLSKINMDFALGSSGQISTLNSSVTTQVPELVNTLGKLATTSLAFADVGTINYISYILDEGNRLSCPPASKLSGEDLADVASYCAANSLTAPKNFIAPVDAHYWATVSHPRIKAFLEKPASFRETFYFASNRERRILSEIRDQLVASVNPQTKNANLTQFCSRLDAVVPTLQEKLLLINSVSGEETTKLQTLSDEESKTLQTLLNLEIANLETLSLEEMTNLQTLLDAEIANFGTLSAEEFTNLQILLDMATNKLQTLTKTFSTFDYEVCMPYNALSNKKNAKNFKAYLDGAETYVSGKSGIDATTFSEQLEYYAGTDSGIPKLSNLWSNYQIYFAAKLDNNKVRIAERALQGISAITSLYDLNDADKQWRNVQTITTHLNKLKADRTELIVQNLADKACGAKPKQCQMPSNDNCEELSRLDSCIQNTEHNLAKILDIDTRYLQYIELTKLPNGLPKIFTENGTNTNGVDADTLAKINAQVDNYRTLVSTRKSSLKPKSKPPSGFLKEAATIITVQKGVTESQIVNHAKNLSESPTYLLFIEVSKPEVTL